MKIELIPVLEIGYSDPEIEAPDLHPYWEHPKEWAAYWRKNLKNVGFEDEFKPYALGSAYYDPKFITERSLTRIACDHTEEFRDGEYERDEISCFYGGYVLRVNGEDKFFPQCCSDLGDIRFWESIAQGQDSYNEGHPAPELIFGRDEITLDFTVADYDEAFVPPPPETILKIDRKILQLAVEEAQSELMVLARRLIRINQREGWGIERIDDLLIWENPNHT